MRSLATHIRLCRSEPQFRTDDVSAPARPCVPPPSPVPARPARPSLDASPASWLTVCAAWVVLMALAWLVVR